MWLCLILAIPLRLFAQSVPEASSVRSAALAGSVVGFPQGSPLDANPAASPIDSMHSFCIEGIFTPNVAGLEHSNQLVATVAGRLEMIGATIGAGFVHYGYGDLFANQTLALSLERSFLGDRRASAGLRARYQTLSFGTAMPQISSLFFDAGIQFMFSPSIGVGVAGQNILGAHIDLTDGTRETFERNFDVGIVLAPVGSKIALSVATHTTVGDHTRGRFGAEYVLEDHIVLRVGALTDPSVITGGIGLNYHGLGIDAGALYSPLSTALTMGLSWAW